MNKLHTFFRLLSIPIIVAGMSGYLFAAPPDTLGNARSRLLMGPDGMVMDPDTVLLKKHLNTLASDDMEGRETGTKGEQLAYEYIMQEFRKVGLLPKGTQGYIQPFPFHSASYMGPGNELVAGKQSFKATEQFYPLGYSSNGSFEGKTIRVGYGIAAPGSDPYAGLGNLKGQVFVMESGYPPDMDPHSRMGEFADLRTRIDSAVAHGAVAVVFVNSDKDTEDPSSKYSNRITPASIPVVFATGDAAKTLNSEKSIRVSGKTDIRKDDKTGHNVIGYIDNGAPYTVVIGAHYDHLGYGIEGSLYRGEKAIHNGADDNASGTSALIELARIIGNSKMKGHNFLFVAFSGEEMGLLGSNYLMKNLPVPIDQISFMLNMDMVGRLKPEEPVLLVNGTGTSPEWSKALANITPNGFKIKSTESGIGPSDHTSFYLKDIPVLHFFSGTHSDYHKPSDDAYKINYAGEQEILEYMLQLLAELDNKGKLPFTKTNDSNNEETPRFKVTLGVVPDYAFEGSGMRIDGISDGKPAQKAGLQAGDVVIQLGSHKVTDMMSYMKALGAFNKGDKTTVQVTRGGETITREVEF